VSEPYFDGEKLALWLRLHPPALKGKTSLFVDQTASDNMSAEYSVVLNLPRPTEVLELSLETPVAISDLFPHAFAPFTMLELAQLADAGELEVKYRERVEAEFKLFRWSVAWETSTLDIEKVSGRTSLDWATCELRIQGTIPPRSSSVGYTTVPYVSLTEEPVELRAFLDEETLEQLWEDCWQKGINFREFT